MKTAQSNKANEIMDYLNTILTLDFDPATKIRLITDLVEYYKTDMEQ